uniref:hypothetical protein n=1 Tax=Rhodothermus marinus TaxID=29549 RepID=UPI000A6A0795
MERHHFFFEQPAHHPVACDGGLQLGQVVQYDLDRRRDVLAIVRRFRGVGLLFFVADRVGGGIQ